MQVNKLVSTAATVMLLLSFIILIQINMHFPYPIYMLIDFVWGRVCLFFFSGCGWVLLPDTF